MYLAGESLHGCDASGRGWGVCSGHQARLVKQAPVKGHGTSPAAAAADISAVAPSSGCRFGRFQLSNAGAAPA